MDMLKTAGALAAVPIVFKVARAFLPHSLGGKKRGALSPLNIVSNLKRVDKVFSQYDGDHDKLLSFDEGLELLNGPEYAQTMKQLINITPQPHTREQLKPIWDSADKEGNGKIGRREFAALYLSLVPDRIKHDPLVLAEGLFGFLDLNRNGRIDGAELKVALALIGFPAAVLLPLPKFINVPYADILNHLRTNFTGTIVEAAGAAANKAKDVLA